MDFFAHEYTSRTRAQVANESNFFQRKVTSDFWLIEMISDDCKGWESDPQSFCIAVAKHFLSHQFSMAAQAETVHAEGDGGCLVFFDNDAVILVQRFPDSEVWVSVSAQNKNKTLGVRSCTYSYRCASSGALVLSTKKCTGKNPKP